MKLSSEIDELGDYYIGSIDLLFDDISTIMFSIVAPDSFDTVGPEMAALHTIAQDLSDKYDRNIVITTVGGVKGGRTVLFNSDDFYTDNVVELNPNKELRRTAAPAPPPIEVRPETSPAYMLESACMAAEEYFSLGFVEESRTITEKMAEVAIVLLKRGRLSLSDIEVKEKCFDIAKLYVVHERRDDAERFLEQTGHESDWIKGTLDTFCDAEGSRKSSRKDIINESTKKLIDDLHGLL